MFSFLEDVAGIFIFLIMCIAFGLATIIETLHFFWKSFFTNLRIIRENARTDSNIHPTL
ncbi:MAG: hypothetical protein ACKUBY_03510 [Candidatus Moraniibacteriota bacterium]|jgi:hypothetical protein